MAKTSFIMGALLGVAAGLLLAPKKGEDLRDDIADSAKKYKDKLRKMAGKMPDLEHLQNVLSNEIEGLGEDVRYRMLTVLNEAV